jgi:hypothetical protein
MDFLDFLNKRPKQTEKVIEKVIEKNTEKVIEKVIEKVKKTESVKYYDDINFTEFKKGDFIKIICMKDSHLNTYKGYNGEIRIYSKGNSHAFVMLDAISANKMISFHVDHFIKREF